MRRKILMKTRSNVRLERQAVIRNGHAPRRFNAAAMRLLRNLFPAAIYDPVFPAERAPEYRDGRAKSSRRKNYGDDTDHVFFQSGHL